MHLERVVGRPFLQDVWGCEREASGVPPRGQEFSRVLTEELAVGSVGPDTVHDGEAEFPLGQILGESLVVCVLRALAVSAKAIDRPPPKVGFKHAADERRRTNDPPR